MIKATNDGNAGAAAGVPENCLGVTPAASPASLTIELKSFLRRSLAILLVAIPLLASCGRRSIGDPSKTTPVILISIDTLRSDHLPAYGYKGVATPNIDSLRADSILYERAYSHVPLTLPSHVSILTGMLPADSGIHDNIGYRLSESIPTLSELLKKNGYATGAAVSAFVLRRETGIARGFDFFEDSTKSVNMG